MSANDNGPRPWITPRVFWTAAILSGATLAAYLLLHQDRSICAGPDALGCLQGKFVGADVHGKELVATLVLLGAPGFIVLCLLLGLLGRVLTWLRESLFG